MKYIQLKLGPVAMLRDFAFSSAAHSLKRGMCKVGVHVMFMSFSTFSEQFGLS